MSAPGVVVHVLQYGLPVCGFNTNIPARWPHGNKWCRADQIAQARRLGLRLCADCVPGEASITCPRCKRTSYNPNDIREGYCGACHAWTGEPRA